MDDDVFSYARGLSKVMRVKDIEAMWPVGILSTAVEFGGAAAELFEELLSSPKSTSSEGERFPTFPTSYLVTLSVLMIGAVSNGWPKTRTIQLANRYLKEVKKRKHGSILNADGRNVLIDDQCVERYLRWLDAEPFRQTRQKRSVNRLSSFLLAYCEAVYFQFHRIGTEKHGPYLSDGSENRMLVRSVANVTPPFEIWPELDPEEFKSAFKSVEVGWLVRSNNYSFDGFANFIHNTDMVADTSATKVSFGEFGSPFDGSDLTAEDVEELSQIVMQRIRSVVPVVNSLSKDELRNRFIGNMLLSNHGILSEFSVHWMDMWAEVARRGQGRRSDATDIDQQKCIELIESIESEQNDRS